MVTNTRNENRDWLLRMNQYKKERVQWFQRWSIQKFSWEKGIRYGQLCTHWMRNVWAKNDWRKKRNHQKFWVWAKYNSKWTEVCFSVMHLVQPGSNWQYNYNQHKHNHEAPLWLSWGYKKHILVQMNTLKDNFYNINRGTSRILVYFSLWKIRT